MRRVAQGLAVFLVLVGVASADEEPAEPTAAPLTPAQATEQVLQAVEAGDRAALRALAEAARPDPWLVADELCRRGERRAAKAFAAAAQRPDVAALPDHVARREGVADRSDLRLALEETAELTASDPALVLETLTPLDAGADDVVSILVVVRIGNAYAKLNRPREAMKAHLDAAGRSERIGWLAAASRNLGRVIVSAEAAREVRTAATTGERLVRLEQLRKSRADEAVALLNLAWHYRNLRRLDEAAAAAEQAHGLVERVGEAERVFAGMAERKLDEVRATSKLQLAYARWDRGDRDGAEQACRQAAAGFARLDLHARAAQSRVTLGDRLVQAGKSVEAVVELTAALAGYQRARNASGIAWASASLGLAYSTLGRFEESLAAYTRAHEIAKGMNATYYVAKNLSNLGVVHWRLAQFDEAFRCLQEALGLYEELDNPGGVADVLTNLGLVHFSLAEYERAAACHSRSLALQERVGNEDGVARALNNLSGPYLADGRYALAMRSVERALDIARKLDDPRLVATILGNLATICTEIRVNQRALALHEEALRLKEELADRAGVAATHMHIGRTLEQLGEHDRAHDVLLEARDGYREVGDPAGEAEVLLRLGSVEARRRRHASSRACYSEAKKLFEAVGSPLGVGWAEFDLGEIHVALGETEKALAAYHRSLEIGERVGSGTMSVLSLARIARARMALGESGEALSVAGDALERLPERVSGLGDDEGAAARARFADVYRTGALAATRLGDPGSFVAFVEAGRAGALLEWLKGSASLRDQVVPEDLRSLEEAARREEAAARVRHRRAVEDGHRKTIRARRDELAAARHRVAEVVRKIRSRARAAADVVYPSPDSLEEIQGRLKGGDALLLYALLDGEVAVLVVTPGSARLLRLGGMDEIRDGVRTLADPAPGSDPRPVVRTLRGRLLDPLGLGKEVRRLLVCPDGILSYVPFALLDRTREIAYVPSGTTYGVLTHERGRRGQVVLALGDPDYEGRELPPLPRSRKEVSSIGDEILLGPGASETLFRTAVSKNERWRAVHLACHGLVDPERPMLSSLALTADTENDGFLTVLDVFRMRIPSDLVVLSACRTAEGQVHEVAGVVGFARAFMFAGSPRVIVSLWKVDDAATQALMTRFYELWNPKDGESGMSAATALKQAQDHVAAQDAWKHPIYWAAWQLWGLPD